MPDVYLSFHQQHTLGSLPLVNFNLPFEVNEVNWLRIKRVGSRIFFLFALLDGLSALCYLQGLYDHSPLPYSRVSGLIFCGCICSYLIGTYLASKKK